MSQLFQVKSLDRMIDDAAHGTSQLKRTLGSVPADDPRHRRHHRRGHLLHDRHGGRGRAGSTSAPARPSSISFLLTAIACGFAALCYAEFASMVPISGSGLHLRLRHARRAGRVDHRLGPDHRVRRRQRGGRDLLVRLLPGAAAEPGPRVPGLAGHRLPVGGHGDARRRRRGGQGHRSLDARPRDDARGAGARRGAPPARHSHRLQLPGVPHRDG